MPSVVAFISSPIETRLEDSPSPSFLTSSTNTTATAVNLLATGTTFAATAGAGEGQSSLKCSDALITQKQHQLAYIQQQQRLQQEKQRQLLYSQQQRHQQYLRCSGQLSFSGGQQYLGVNNNSGAGTGKKGKETRSVDLVDDVWRLVFYMLACDCKDLGRSMQVNRRFHNLIAHDALLWRLTYKLTISGSIFAGQKPLLSPTWIREEHQLQFQQNQQSSREALRSSSSPFSSSSSFAHQDQSESTSNGAPPHTLAETLDSPDDRGRNDDGLDLMMSSNEDDHGQRRGSIGQRGAESSSALSGLGPVSISGALASSQSRLGSQSTGSLHSTHNTTTTATNNNNRRLSIAPGLQMPSPLILPHHRRIAQKMSSVNSGQQQQTTPAQIAAGAAASQSQTSYFSGTTNSTNSSSGNLGPTTTSTNTTTTTTRTSASTPATSSMASFPSTLSALSASVSQVASSSSSTTPLRVIQHHIPSTTLMHHPPAVYWKHQVVEWLEQEKLRCLRLGLFWGFNAAASRAHGRKTDRSR